MLQISAAHFAAGRTSHLARSERNRLVPLQGSLLRDRERRRDDQTPPPHCTKLRSISVRYVPLGDHFGTSFFGRLASEPSSKTEARHVICACRASPTSAIVRQTSERVW